MKPIYEQTFTEKAATKPAALRGLEQQVLAHAKQEDHGFYTVNCLHTTRGDEGYLAEANICFYSF